MDKEKKETFQKEIPNLYPRLHRALSAYLTGTNIDPEDILQEAFLKAYKNIEHFQGSSSLYTWLYSIARNLSIDEMRKLNKEKGRSSVPVEEFEIASDEYSSRDQREEILQLRKGIAQLPELLRTIVVMKSIDGLSYSEISEVTGVNEQTLKNRMFRARKELVQIMKKNRV
ncbi:MAG: RNA polymerase sigma factor [Balneolaceae bacterium]|nr:RNA polymerase sigma factor [Balneolaceae bacterium]